MILEGFRSRKYDGGDLVSEGNPVRDRAERPSLILRSIQGVCWALAPDIPPESDQR